MTDLSGTRETCSMCGRPTAVGFTVPDDVWQRVADGRWDVLCLRCFCIRADELLIEWDRDITFWPVSMATVIRLHEAGRLP